MGNVAFFQGDVTGLDTVLAGRPGFDAVVGRMILMYVADPAAVVRAAARHVRPGGIMYFAEPDATYRCAFPATPLTSQVQG